MLQLETLSIEVVSEDLQTLADGETLFIELHTECEHISEQLPLQSCKIRSCRKLNCAPQIGHSSNVPNASNVGELDGLAFGEFENWVCISVELSTGLMAVPGLCKVCSSSSIPDDEDMLLAV